MTIVVQDYNDGIDDERARILEIIDKSFHKVKNRVCGKKRHYRLQISYPKWIELKNGVCISPQRKTTYTDNNGHKINANQS